MILFYMHGVDLRGQKNQGQNDKVHLRRNLQGKELPSRAHIRPFQPVNRVTL
jgi:hypothetical protein